MGAGRLVSIRQLEKHCWRAGSAPTLSGRHVVPPPECAPKPCNPAVRPHARVQDLGLWWARAARLTDAFAPHGASRDNAAPTLYQLRPWKRLILTLERTSTWR